MRLPFERNRFLAGAAVPALLSLCCALAFAQSTEAACGAPPCASTFPAKLNAHFAIADLDGDRKPDLATVEIENANSASRMRYLIRFELTAGAPQVIGVTAPAGGLQIVARDVNGDEMLDLLVSTEWLNQPVAILLNDGHGNFTLSEPGAFGGVVWEAESWWRAAGFEIRDASAAILSRNFSNDAAESASFSLPQQSRGTVVCTTAHATGFSEVLSVFGRAPPAFVFPA
jgi:hypothetical protein